MTKKINIPVCPSCGSDDVCPAITENRTNDNSPLIIFISAFLIIGGYLLFVLYSYLFFPLTAIIFAILASLWLNKRDPFRKKKVVVLPPEQPKNWFCKNCEENFNVENPVTTQWQDKSEEKAINSKNRD